MTSTDVERLLNVLNQMRRELVRMNDALERRQPYKPLILSLPGRDLTESEFYRMKEILDDYFKNLEGNSTRATEVAQEEGI
jgi:hypothetical protein